MRSPLPSLLPSQNTKWLPRCCCCRRRRRRRCHHGPQHEANQNLRLVLPCPALALYSTPSSFKTFSPQLSFLLRCSLYTSTPHSTPPSLSQGHGVAAPTNHGRESSIPSGGGDAAAALTHSLLHHGLGSRARHLRTPGGSGGSGCGGEAAGAAGAVSAAPRHAAAHHAAARLHHAQRRLHHLLHCYLGHAVRVPLLLPRPPSPRRALTSLPLRPTPPPRCLCHFMAIPPPPHPLPPPLTPPHRRSKLLLGKRGAFGAGGGEGEEEGKGGEVAEEGRGVGGGGWGG
ncbi:unnamed protein product [Closterium sp. NIES-54]